MRGGPWAAPKDRGEKVESLLFQGLIGINMAMDIWLVASGLTLIFGVLGVLNFAHGSLYMLGAYLAFTFVERMGSSFWLSMLIASLMVAVFGGIMERFFIRFVYQLEVVYQLILTFAFILILDDAVKMIWGPVYKSPPIPSFLDGSVKVFNRAFPIYNLFIIGVGPLVALGLWAMLEKTWWGKIIRASAADKEMASAIGINVTNLYTWVFAFGAWLGAIGGALTVPVKIISPGMGTLVIIEAFVVAVIGGLGSLKGAFVGAILIGLLHAYGTMYFPVFEMAFVFILLAVVLLVRPQGLFGEG
jgi:branched-subunit amino acid ABC-type transport system permease component